LEEAVRGGEIVKAVEDIGAAMSCEEGAALGEKARGCGAEVRDEAREGDAERAGRGGAVVVGPGGENGKEDAREARAQRAERGKVKEGG